MTVITKFDTDENVEFSADNGRQYVGLVDKINIQLFGVYTRITYDIKVDKDLYCGIAEACVRTIPPKGKWVFERSSGYIGLRCKTCMTWIYADQKRRCKCDEE